MKYTEIVVIKTLPNPGCEISSNAFTMTLLYYVPNPQKENVWWFQPERQMSKLSMVNHSGKPL